MLKDEGPLGDFAREELQKIAKETSDPANQKAAENALKNAPTRPAPKEPKKDVTEKDVAKLKDLAQKQGPVGDAAQQQLKDLAQKAQDPAAQKAAQDALKNQGPRTPRRRAIDPGCRETQGIGQG